MALKLLYNGEPTELQQGDRIVIFLDQGTYGFRREGGGDRRMLFDNSPILGADDKRQLPVAPLDELNLRIVLRVITDFTGFYYINESRHPEHVYTATLTGYP